MRVVVAGDYPEHPPTILGGIQAVIYNTLQRLRDYEDLDLHVVTCEKWRDSVPDRAQVVEDGRLTVHYLPSSPRIPHTVSMATTDRWEIGRRIKALAPDLIHAHGQAAAYPFAAFDTGRPTVVSVHGINMLEAQLERRGGWLRGSVRAGLWGYAERSCLRRATDLVATSPFVGRVIARHVRGRVHVIENPVDETFLCLEPDPVPGRVLIVGTIRPLKGTMEAIQAMKLVRQQLPHAELCVVGPFVAPFRDYGDLVQQAVAQGDTSTYVHLMGHLEHEALLDAYRTGHVFLLPSWQESSPVALAQAMAAGLPSVVSDIGGIEHLIAEDETGYRFPPRNVDALAKGILRLLNNPETCQRFGRRARQVAQARFSPELAAQRTHDLYRWLIDARSPAGLSAGPA
jgi:glycosyltransferase involved in cell wall biosynthesis